MGTIANNPSELEDADYLLLEYKADVASGGMSRMLPSLRAVLRNLEGPYAFIIHDRNCGRILAARDVSGEQTLFWGSNSNGGDAGLLFGSDLALLTDDCRNAGEFPSGKLFISNQGSVQGTLKPLDAPVSGNSDGLQPELCKAESRNNLLGMTET